MIRDCSTCKYEHNDGHTQPCRDCVIPIENYTNWKRKEYEPTIEQIKEERYNQGFVDGYRRATEQAINCVGQIKISIKCLYHTDVVLNNDGDYASMDSATLDKVLEIIDRHMENRKIIKNEIS